MIDFGLDNKTAMITGASRGIGEAIAVSLAQHGAHCLLVSRKIEGLQKVADRIADLGGRADPMVCNISSLDDIAALFEKVKDEVGRLDILVNNAAANPYFGLMENAPGSAFDKTIAVNLRGPFYMIQHAVGLMGEGMGGSIVNISSINAVSPKPMQGVYAITKAGLVAMTKGYAKELANRNIRVNAVLPGLTKTQFSEALFDDENIYKNAMLRIPMQRHAAPEEMAGAVVYLASDAASYTTGTTIVCDGGALS